MKATNTIWIVGTVLLLMCGPVLAHDRGGYAVYPSDGWSGAVTIYGGSHGFSGWTGSLNYAHGANYGYTPGYVRRVIPHRHGPSCRHLAGHRYGKAYRKGYRHGRRHALNVERGHRHHH